MITGDQLISVETTVKASAEDVWHFWTTPEHITQWHVASGDWHTPRAENELTEGGKFLYRMEARNGEFGFDYWGSYDEVKQYESIVSTLGDGRKVSVSFEPVEDGTQVTEAFVPDKEFSLEQQRQGWQTMLDNFKAYTETHKVR